MNKSDFTMYEKKGKIYSMGFEFNNMLKKNYLPAMVGGGTNKNSHCSIPVGLALLNTKSLVPKLKQYSGGVVDNNLYNKLLHLSEQRKTTNSKTKKRRKKLRNKTRKL